MPFLARKRILLPAAVRLLAFGVSLGLYAGAQNPQDQAKIKDLLSHLTLQEEIRMLSGSSLMSTTGIERLRIPSFRMSDGPWARISRGRRPLTPGDWQPGETRHVMVPLEARSFTWYDEKAPAWRADAGSYTIHVSRSSADAQLEGKIVLPKPIVLPVN
jgi:fibronectin type III domain protein